MNLDLRVVSREINEILWKAEKTLSTAESCTAGRIATVLTAIPGSSNYYKGGIVCYSNEVKVEVLGVKEETLTTYTAVSEETVKEMVAGALQRLHSDYAIAVTGYAGPDGDNSTVLGGTIWIAVGNREEVKTFKMEGDEGRDKNLVNATTAAIHLFLDFLKDKERDIIEKSQE